MIPMVIGREIRLNRILRDGKMLCIPMDHGISNGPIMGLENPLSLIYNCEHAGLTCVLVNKGIIKSMPRPIGIGLIGWVNL
jgi:fructose-bisphosphate aldolase/2-amino-3,7-dideoxy-D-threo-hept-6-ulosonate synthase